MDERNQEEQKLLSETEILEVFRMLRLSSAAERESFLKLERLGEVPAAADDSPFTFRFDDSTAATAL